MLKREITYEDFNGETVTDTFYFNLTRTELIELELSYEGGLEESIQKIIKAEDVKALISEFQKIVLASYGVRTPDGKRFIKNDQLREEFSQTAAYDALFMDLATNENSAADFIKGIIPADLSRTVDMGTVSIPTVVNVNLPPVPPQEG